MLQVAELQSLAKARLVDAQSLLNADRYDGAVYVCGYAVELRLKARICRTLHWAEFPKTRGEFDGLQSLKTHDLDVLLRLSGREAYIRSQHLTEWSALRQWNPERRYEPVGTVSKQFAEEMLLAAKLLSKKL
jgi:hypothetical protein